MIMQCFPFFKCHTAAEFSTVLDSENNKIVAHVMACMHLPTAKTTLLQAGTLREVLNFFFPVSSMFDDVAY